MNQDRLRLFIIVFVSILIVSFSMAYVILESSDEQVFILSTLGSNIKASNYYPKGNTINVGVSVGEEVTWHIQVYNKRGSPELVQLKVKILNSTQIVPDDNTHTPSPEQSIFEITHLIANNATWTTPLTWSIVEIENIGDYIIIKKMKINEEEINTNIKSINGDNFRIVIELWRYDPDNKSFEFAWKSNNEYRSVWNQIWFNVR